MNSYDFFTASDIPTGVDIIYIVILFLLVGIMVCCFCGLIYYVIKEETFLVEKFQARGFKKLSRKWHSFSLMPNEAVRIMNWAWLHSSDSKGMIANYGLTEFYTNVDEKSLIYLFNVASLSKKNERAETHIKQKLRDFKGIGISETVINEALPHLKAERNIKV